MNTKFLHTFTGQSVQLSRVNFFYTAKRPSVTVEKGGHPVSSYCVCACFDKEPTHRDLILLPFKTLEEADAARIELCNELSTLEPKKEK